MASQEEDNKLECISNVNKEQERYYLNVYKKYDSILNDKSESFENKVTSLIEVWSSISELNLSLFDIRYVIQIIDWAKLHALNIVLTGEWRSTKESFRNSLLKSIEKAQSSLASVNEAFSSRCQKLADVVKKPWENPVLANLIQEKDVEIGSKEIEFFCVETAYLVSVRLKKLCENHCEDLALNLVTNFLNYKKLATVNNFNLNATETQLWFIFDIYIALLYKFQDKDKILEQFEELRLEEGVMLIKRFAKKRVKISKIWRNCHKIAIFGSRFFMSRTLMEYVDEFKDFLTEVLKTYLVLSNTDPLLQEFVLSVRNITNLADAAGLCVMCEVIHREAADKLRVFAIEMYIRALTTDMNELERLKHVNEDDKVKSTTSRLANTFTNLADLLDDHVKVARECVLTAFSLEPTKDRLTRIQDFAKRSGFPVLDTGQEWKCRLHPPILPSDDVAWICSECGEWMCKPELTAPLQMNMALHEALQESVLGISEALCDDLVVCLSNPRYQILSWLLAWGDLYRLCILYLNDPEKTKNFVTELKFVDVDYSMFEHIKREPVDEYTGIEKGYEQYLDLDFVSDEETSSVSEDSMSHDRCVELGSDGAGEPHLPLPQHKSDPVTLKSLRMFRPNLKRKKDDSDSPTTDKKTLMQADDICLVSSTSSLGSYLSSPQYNSQADYSTNTQIASRIYTNSSILNRTPSNSAYLTQAAGVTKQSNTSNSSQVSAASNFSSFGYSPTYAAKSFELSKQPVNQSRSNFDQVNSRIQTSHNSNVIPVTCPLKLPEARKNINVSLSASAILQPESSVFNTINLSSASSTSFVSNIIKSTLSFGVPKVTVTDCTYTSSTTSETKSNSNTSGSLSITQQGLFNTPKQPATTNLPSQTNTSLLQSSFADPNLYSQKNLQAAYTLNSLAFSKSTSQQVTNSAVTDLDALLNDIDANKFETDSKNGVAATLLQLGGQVAKNQKQSIQVHQQHNLNPIPMKLLQETSLPNGINEECKKKLKNNTKADNPVLTGEISDRIMEPPPCKQQKLTHESNSPVKIRSPGKIALKITDLQAKIQTLNLEYIKEDKLRPAGIIMDKAPPQTQKTMPIIQDENIIKPFKVPALSPKPLLTHITPSKIRIPLEMCRPEIKSSNLPTQCKPLPFSKLGHSTLLQDKSLSQTEVPVGQMHHQSKTLAEQVSPILTCQKEQSSMHPVLPRRGATIRSAAALQQAPEAQLTTVLSKEPCQTLRVEKAKAIISQALQQRQDNKPSVKKPASELRNASISLVKNPEILEISSTSLSRLKAGVNSQLNVCNSTDKNQASPKKLPATCTLADSLKIITPITMGCDKDKKVQIDTQKTDIEMTEVRDVTSLTAEDNNNLCISQVYLQKTDEQVSSIKDRKYIFIKENQKATGTSLKQIQVGFGRTSTQNIADSIITNSDLTSDSISIESKSSTGQLEYSPDNAQNNSNKMDESATLTKHGKIATGKTLKENDPVKSGGIKTVDVVNKNLNCDKKVANIVKINSESKNSASGETKSIKKKEICNQEMIKTRAIRKKKWHKCNCKEDERLKIGVKEPYQYVKYVHNYCRGSKPPPKSSKALEERESSPTRPQPGFFHYIKPSENKSSPPRPCPKMEIIVEADLSKINDHDVLFSDSYSKNYLDLNKENIKVSSDDSITDTHSSEELDNEDSATSNNTQTGTSSINFDFSHFGKERNITRNIKKYSNTHKTKHENVPCFKTDQEKNSRNKSHSSVTNNLEAKELSVDLKRLPRNRTRRVQRDSSSDSIALLQQRLRERIKANADAPICVLYNKKEHQKSPLSNLNVRNQIKKKRTKKQKPDYNRNTIKDVKKKPNIAKGSTLKKKTDLPSKKPKKEKEIRFSLRTQEKRAAKSMLNNVPGLNDFSEVRPRNTQHVVNVVQVSGSRSSTITSQNTQTSTQVTPHIQRIGQPKQSEQKSGRSEDKPEQSTSSSATTSRESLKSTPQATARAMSGQAKPIQKSKARQAPLINILSQQILKQPGRPASTHNNNDRPTSNGPRRDRGEGNGPRRDRDEGNGPRRDRDEGNGPRRDRDEGNGPRRDRDEGNGPRRDRDEGNGLRRDRDEGNDPSRDRDEGPTKTATVMVESEQNAEVQASKSINTNIKIITSTSQAGGPASTATSNQGGTILQFICKSSSLPKFQQAFGKTVYQTNSSSEGATEAAEAPTSENLNQTSTVLDTKKIATKTQPVNVQPITGNVIFRGQVPVGQTVSLIPPGSNTRQLFRITGSTHEQISLVKETVIQNKMSALLAAALQGKPKITEQNGELVEEYSATRITLCRPGTVPPNATRIVKPVQLQIPANVIRAPQPNLSSTTLEQLREFDMVYKQVKERSSNPAQPETTVQSCQESPQQQRISFTYVNQVQKYTQLSPVVVVSSYSPIQQTISPALTVTSQTSAGTCLTQVSTVTVPKVAVKTSKGKNIKSSATKTSPAAVPTIPKPQQKPQEDEHTTQRIFDILAEYAEQLRNSPDLNNKPAPRRRSNPPTNPSSGTSGSSSSKKKKKKSNSSTTSNLVETDNEDLTMGSEDSSGGNIVQLSMTDEEQSQSASITPPETNLEPATSSTSTPRSLIVTDTSNQPRNVIIADSSVGEALKMPNTALIMPGSYIMPVSVVKGGQQIAVVSGGSKILTTVPARSGQNMLLFQSFVNQNKKGGISTVKYSTIQPFSGIASQNLAGVSPQSPVVLPSNSVATVALGQPITLKKLDDNERGTNSELLLTISQPREAIKVEQSPDIPQPDSSTGLASDTIQVKIEEGSQSDSSSNEVFNTIHKTSSVATSVIASVVKKEEEERSGNSAAVVISAVKAEEPTTQVERIGSVLVNASISNGPMLSHTNPRYRKPPENVESTNTPTKEFNQNVGKAVPSGTKIFKNNAVYYAIRTKKAVGKKLDSEMQKQAAMEREIRLQKSLSEECEDLGVDEPSTSDLFPEADLLFDSNHSPSYDQTGQRIQVAEVKAKASMNLFSDDENSGPMRNDLFDYVEYHPAEAGMDQINGNNGSNESASSCDDTTLLPNCGTMSEVTLNSPISPEYTDNTLAVNKYKYKYTNRKKGEKAVRSQTENWSEVTSTEDTIELAKEETPSAIQEETIIDESITDLETIIEKKMSPEKDLALKCSVHGSADTRSVRKNTKKPCSCFNGSRSPAPLNAKRRVGSPKCQTPTPNKKPLLSRKR